MLIIALISLFLFVPYGVLIAWYYRAWKAIPLFEPSTTGNSPVSTGAHSLAAGDTPSPTRISVLVPARNEETNIGVCLDSLSRQTYPKSLYEVIVVDDHSTDRTADIVKQRTRAGEHADQQAGLRLKYISLSDQGSGSGLIKAHKKFAIETGIRAAGGELIVTTDADCQFHPDWLRTIAAFYEEKNARFIAAPVRIGDAAVISPETPPSSFLSIFQTLDFITLQGITGAAVSKKFHSMCNGANLAYTKTVFDEVGGFRDIDDIPSGDDMLLMHKIYKKYPGQVFFLKNRQAIVSTKAESSWRGFFNQRIRWASKADRYEDLRIFWTLLLVYMVNIALLCIWVACFWEIRFLWLFLILLTGKTIIEFPFVRSVARWFGQQDLMPWFPVMQPLHILYTVVVGWLGKFGSYRWKDRKTVK